MSKKQIIILISVFFIILGSILFIFIFIPTIDSNKLKIENYKLKYGLYEGYETEYNQDLEKTVKTKKELILLDEETIKMGEQIYTFTIKGNKLYVYGQEYFEVTENNKLTLVLGGGIEYVWKKEVKKDK